ncbi:MAG: sugar phosphate isomerase/epimerase [Spirochaetales bacterium]|nr:sugar phosphate isomerase/epimerase [Spirochaetales bacterium]
MDIGIHVSLWTKEWTDPYLDYIDLAAELGFTSVEIPLMDPASLPIGEIKERIERTGLGVYCGTGLGPATDISSDDAGIRAAGLEHLKKCLTAAAHLGSPSLQGVIHSAWGKRSRTTGAERKNSALVLREVADYASEQGLRIALECINRYESSFLNTAAQGMEMLEMINRPNAGLHLDTYHMNIEEQSFEEVFRLTRGKLFHLHMSENNRGYPGSGLLDWASIIDQARQNGYTGPWVIESYVVPNCPEGDDVCIWRRIEGDTLASLGGSLKLLRKLIKNENR